MTTEIAIMNSSGVVLAADSTLTVSNGNGKLHYPGVDKIFGLSAYDPVAIMIHGRPDFLGIPWDVVIKTFRDSFSGRLDNLQDYSVKFFGHLEDFCRNHIDNNTQDEALLEYATVLFEKAREVSWRHVKKFVQKKYMENKDFAKSDFQNKITESFKRHMVHEVKSVLSSIEKIPLRQGITLDGSQKFEQEIHKKITKNIVKINSDVFDSMRLSEEFLNNLTTMASKASVKNVISQVNSGVVFAGYGQKEIFPSIMWFDIDTFFNNKLIYRERGRDSITFEKRASFHSFGNTETVNGVMSGISSEFREYFGESVEEHYAKNHVSVIGFDIESVREIFDKMADTVERRFRKRILSTIALLPKQTLAEIAANLIMLSSTMSQVSEVDGSVGGPVSSAVISRGDGMIWIHRQHYFDAENNPHYMARYSNRNPRHTSSEK